MKILVGVDESEHGQQAIDWVRRMTLPKETEVVVVSVARTPMVLSTEAYAPGLAYDDEALKGEFEFRTRIANEAATSLGKSGLTATTRVVTGDARLEIIDLAHKEKCDLVVVGSHGRTGLAKLLLGSTASHVVTHAPCSVLVVKERKTPG
ncbi:MAG TPA: universal stress protein [Candidatus Eisenbacteria bacterium]